ncbi:NADH-FMN oxidoreductase RutF, flavin reductase (DIM6/NTAB) family [Cognatiyoonia koreensis]|uniref:NADH-FMN oxidoreductase RutF, flavin reductase (DIM6/NTAB) family n=1 Tax=Cognatiyoonia koreensis TaxID=364200 RepID=A0A1I0PV18_9RHOB|nr:flavin reductase family protein [Cognatiyoonia koreensis]SEW18178.1 NADH-FMN oxidoreductase RutF, flavin reductase (DIM6/NTAB) family [Cognatiyoonia koreensis]
MDAGTIATFDPSTDSESFRGALGTFVTGVTIVTTDSPEGPVAIVANSFASVSLDPPLVLWSPAKASRRFEHFAGSRRFAVHVLAAEQRDICAAIIKSKTAIKKVPMHLSHCGMPIIEGALAAFECNLEATHDAGDHVIVVGRVTKAHHRPGNPLVFHAGKYGEFNAT